MRDVFSRDLTHEVGTAAVSDDALGFHLRCTYAEGGARVLCSSTAELQDGLIVSEVVVQAWDS